MTNKQETNTADVEKAFEEWCAREGSNASFIKDASEGYPRFAAYKAAFTAGARSRDKEIEKLTESRDIALQDLADEAKEVSQLREDLKWVSQEFIPDKVYQENKMEEILKRHNLEEV